MDGLGGIKIYTLPLRDALMLLLLLLLLFFVQRVICYGVLGVF